MKHVLAIIVLVTAAVGCTRESLQPVDPMSKVEIAVAQRPAEGDIPAHFELSAPLADHDPATVSAALRMKAQETCGDGKVGRYLDAASYHSTPLPDPAVIRFPCEPAPIPGRVELAAGAELPAQPELAPGQRRAQSWGTSWGLGERRPFESLLGSQIRGIYAEDCGERGVTLDRIATYAQPLEDGPGRKAHLIIDYRCADATAAPAGTAAR